MIKISSRKRLITAKPNNGYPVVFLHVKKLGVEIGELVDVEFFEDHVVVRKVKKNEEV